MASALIVKSNFSAEQEAWRNTDFDENARFLKRYG